MLANSAIWTFQILYFGPDLDRIYPTLNRFFGAFCLDLQIYISLRDGWFYHMLIVIFFLIMFVLLILILYSFAFRKSFPKSGAIADVKSIIDTLTPILVYSGFVPIFHNTLEVFNCSY
jgi:hypothetical protein